MCTLCKLPRKLPENYPTYRGVVVTILPASTSLLIHILVLLLVIVAETSTRPAALVTIAEVVAQGNEVALHVQVRHHLLARVADLLLRQIPS